MNQERHLKLVHSDLWDQESQTERQGPQVIRIDSRLPRTPDRLRSKGASPAVRRRRTYVAGLALLTAATIGAVVSKLNEGSDGSTKPKDNGCVVFRGGVEVKSPRQAVRDVVAEVTGKQGEELTRSIDCTVRDNHLKSVLLPGGTKIDVEVPAENK